MGFFAEFSSWLEQVLRTYIADVTARIAIALEPAITTLGVLYVMIWGYLYLSGKAEQPVLEFIKRIMILALVLGVSLQLWLYNEIIVDSFFAAPNELAALVVEAPTSVATIDEIIFAGNDVANSLLDKAGLFEGDLSFFFAGWCVYIIVSVVAIYTIFLLSLARIALSILLAIGPLVVPFLLFETTKRFFESWLAQLSNYAFIAILTSLLAALMLHILNAATRRALEAGPEVEVAHAINVGMSACLTLLVMRQVMPMSAGLASGLSLSTFGAMSTAAHWALGKMTRSTREFGRGLAYRRGYAGA